MNPIIPNWQERQKLIYARDRKADPNLIREIGRACLDQGRFQEALEYLYEAKDAEGLKKIEEVALEEGDAFILTGLEKMTAQERDSAIWNKLGYKAMELGKYAFAQKAFERTQNELMLAKIRNILGEETELVSPPDTAA